MMRGINKAEAINWLNNIKKTAPDFVFQAVYELTETELPVQLRAAVQAGVQHNELLY